MQSCSRSKIATSKPRNCNDPVMNILISVVVPTCSRPDMLALCLERLTPGAQTLDISKYEVIVSDDGVATVETLISAKYPWAKWVAGPRRGPAANRNNGATFACGEWLVFTDDDCLPDSGWLAAYASSISNYDILEGRTSSVGTRKRADEECPINESGGFLWSCNFAIKRDRFEYLRGFDESFPSPAMEDVELNTRVFKAMLSRRFVPDAQVLHPWRRRKGRDFAKAYAKSVAYYVKLHPEQAPKFALQSVSMTFLRTFKNRAAHAIKTGQFAGLARQIYLDGCSGFLSWREVARRP